MGERPHAAEGLRSVPVVGIGASAGGIDALTRLLPRIATDSGLAFVLVMHLAPGRTSMLAEVLARHSPLPVTQIVDDTSVLPGHVHVIPPNTVLTIQDGRLQLWPQTAPRSHFNPIDEFLVSLAGDQGENCACVILSGTGSDGTAGLRAVKAHGGLVLAQAQAEYEGMMRSAVATGLVDSVLAAEDMPARLAQYFSHVTRLAHAPGPAGEPAVAARDLDQITAVLRARTGHDFSGYKDRTVIRRVQRRMHVLQIDDLAGFVARLRADPPEADRLFQDILIGVTSFFRDPAAFLVLQQEVIPLLFLDKGPAESVRVWVPGCATGEEAYSIAMLLREHAGGLAAPPRLQVFASDIDERALEVARLGRYPASIARDVSAARLDRWFQREDGSWRVITDLREICLFSNHDLLADAPFSRLDLISCRNLLIYLGSALQERLIPLFHYALNPNGFLFLGTSENVTRHTRLFQTVDKAWRIFRRRGYLERRIPDFPLTSADPARRAPAAPGYRSPSAEPSLRSLAEREMLEQFCPPYVIVNAEGDVLQASGRTGKYLELPAGAPDSNVFSMARPGLRLDLRAAVHRAVVSGEPTLQANIMLSTEGGRQMLDLHVRPTRLGTAPEALLMVVFQDRGPPLPGGEMAPSAATDDAASAGLQQLEMELRSTRERLQSTTEELESSNEELKASNEELQSINEELQSANEELETSKEELQSINEELQTVNAELNARVEDLSRANNDMSNLLESTQIATVFLDRQMVVQSFTPAAKDVFHLVESDAGRPIAHVRARFEAEGMEQDAARVLRTLATIEKPVRSLDGQTLFMLRMLPYRTADNVISGVVLTFTDITRITAAEVRIAELTADLQARVAELETLLDLVPVGVLVADATAAEAPVLINTYGARLLGAGDGNKGLRRAVTPLRLFDGRAPLPPEAQPLQLALRSGAAVPGWQGRLEDQAGRSVDVMISATPLFGDTGEVRGAIAAIVDLSPQVQAEARRRVLLHELQHRVENIVAGINTLAIRMSDSVLPPEDFVGALLSRVVAMARVESLLADGAWGGASLRGLIQTMLEPYRGTGEAATVLEGADIRLAASAAGTLGMVFHELASNAAKYGALAVSGGHVHVQWAEAAPAGAGEADRVLRVVWTECGGPPVSVPAARGLGNGFVARSLEGELAGTASLEFAPGGLVCVLSFPLRGRVATPEPEPCRP